MAQVLSVVIPVYNEIKTIEEVLERVIAVDVGMDKEIILVDDCSADGSRDKLRELETVHGNREGYTVRALYHEVNRGKGAALRTAFEVVSGDMAIIQDADLEYSPQEFPKLMEPILADEADVVYGSRFSEEPEQAAFWHYAGNRFLTWLSNLVNNTQLTDMETCYKLFKTPVLKSILPLRSERFGIEPEMTAKLAKRKYRIVERSITYKERFYKEGKKITWKDGFAAIYHILHFRFTD